MTYDDTSYAATYAKGIYRSISVLSDIVCAFLEGLLAKILGQKALLGTLTSVSTQR